MILVSQTAAKAYKSKIEEISQQLRDDPDNTLLIRERAHLYLARGQTRLARVDFDHLEALSSAVHQIRRGKLASDLELNEIGVTYWIEGHLPLAATYWRYTTESLTANRVAYAEMGGGITTGQLLWFSAVHLRREDDIERTRQLYDARLRSTHWAHKLTGLTGGLVQYFLRQIGGEELLALADYPGAHCKAEFALAIRAKEEARHAAYRKHMRNAATVTDDMMDCYNVPQYFLALFEKQPLKTR